MGGLWLLAWFLQLFNLSRLILCFEVKELCKSTFVCGCFCTVTWYQEFLPDTVFWTIWWTSRGALKKHGRQWRHHYVTYPGPKIYDQDSNTWNRHRESEIHDIHEIGSGMKLLFTFLSLKDFDMRRKKHNLSMLTAFTSSAFNPTNARRP